MEGFLEGSNSDWLNSIIHAETGHIQIMPRGYKDVSMMSPIDNLIPTPNVIKDLVKSSQEVIGVTERLNFGGMIATGEKTAIFSGIGVDVINEYDIFDFISATEGRRLSPLDKEGCLMGSILAKNLGLKVGNDAVLITNTAEGAVNAVNVKIVGIFNSGVPTADSMLLYIPIAHAQKLVNAPMCVSQIILLLDNIQNVESYSIKLNSIIKETSFKNLVEVWKWNELATTYERIISMERFQLSIVEGIMLFLIILSVNIIMLMSVFERVKEIGTLTAFGITSKEIAFLFLNEALMIGFVGGCVGYIVGLVAIKVTCFMGVPFNPPGSTITVYMRPIIPWMRMFIISVITVFTTVIGGLYPAVWGSKIRPTEALRYV